MTIRRIRGEGNSSLCGRLHERTIQIVGIRSPEFALLVACCRWPLTPSTYREIERWANGIDWNRFARLAGRHRVEGLVWRALANADVDVPQAARKELSTAATDIARKNMTIAAESFQLNQLFDRAGVRHMFVKGVTLGQLVYGDIARKAGWDIDLIVGPDDLDRAVEILEGKGYALETPSSAKARERLAIWHRHSKESIWQSADGTMWVELHTALSDNALLIPGIGAASPSDDVEISPGMFLPTLARDELFAYLCVHGASSAWFRLKWIADLAGLIGDAPANEVTRLYRRAIELGAGRSAALALLLARLLFRSAVSPRLWRELRSDRTNRWLVAVALRKLRGRAGAIELDEVFMGTASIHAAQLGLLPGWRFKRAELMRQLVSPIDRVGTPLPSLLTWLYPAIHLARLVRGKIDAPR